MVIDCGCSPLCSRCLDDRFMQLKGTAAMRGWMWARDLRAFSWRGTWRLERALEIARRRVEDLARDLQLRERLAVECERCAREEALRLPFVSRE